MTNSPQVARPAEIVRFWIDAGPKRWFAKDDAFDAAIREKFLASHEAAARHELDGWLDSPASALALILLLDQVPRNIFRDSARSFATDEQGRSATETAIRKGFPESYEFPLRRFFYLPLMHSEILTDQQRCVEILSGANDPEGADFARLHLDIIRRFGRFPHRNRVLGRQTTPEEQAFLASGGFAG